METRNGKDAKPEYERLLNDAPPESTPPLVENGAGVHSTETYTLEEAINSLGMGLFQFLLMVYVGFAWMSDAMEMMLLSFLGPAVRCEWDLTDNEKSAISSVVFVGMLFGAYIWGAVSDALGRKVGFTATATMTALAGFGSALSPNYAALLIFRSLVGFGLGGIPVAFGIFMEFVPSKRRGRLSILMQCAWVIGAMTEAALAWAILPTLGWRALLMFSTAPLVLLLVLFPFLPESPRFLVNKGRIEEAEVILARIARINRKTLPPGRLVGPKLIQDNTEVRKSISTRLASILSGMISELKRTYCKKYLRTSVILHTSWFTNAFAYYGLVLLATELHSQEKGECNGRVAVPISGKDYEDILITTSAEGVGNLVGILIIDLIGRIKSMALSMGVCSFALIPLLAFRLSAHGATAFLFIARGSSLLSFSVLYAYTAEYYPTSMRSFSLGLSNVWSRLGGLVAPFVAVSMVDGGHKSAAEVMLIALCGITAIATMFLQTETTGQALAEDEEDKEEEKISA
ncbi:hypothetical protein BSKO_10151 [Bryopsis sp. KO-2023]|nr:hypothetical protein BSKO_10151 [Bryopsis sp. KO-2023]